MSRQDFPWARRTGAAARSRSGKPVAGSVPAGRSARLPRQTTDLPAAAAPGAAGRPEPLWLCLYLPRLPLDVLVPRDSPVPTAVWEEKGRQASILTPSMLAAARGVRPGMPVNSALALVPDLDLRPRNPVLEAAALTSLAEWSGCFTPAVSIEADEALLLEVRGSLRLFGGLAALRARLLRELARRGYEVLLTGAPTARAALWLARAGRDVVVQGGSSLAGKLATLPVAALGWPERPRALLGQMGIATLGECWRLPRTGLARRLGPDRLQELDQGLGRLPEVRPLYRPPARFHDVLELPKEVRDTVSLMAACKVLLGRLDEHLVARQSAIRVLWCCLRGTAGEEARLRIGLRRAAASISLLLGLLQIRLEAEAPGFGVVVLAVQADLEPVTGPEGADLLGRELAGDGRLVTLLERFRARLGAGAVHGLALVPEHRPERAWRPVAEPLDAPDPGNCPVQQGPLRPVWLLPAPRRLGQAAGTPVWQGPLELQTGPERIETGWWDGDDIRRDYYVARHPRGTRLWIFRELRTGYWYLHGVFG